MPRKGQGPGGIRQGTTGAQYQNRSDLRDPGNETVKGQPYGQAAAQQAAQRAIPITPPPTAAPGPGQAPAAAPGPSAQPQPAPSTPAQVPQGMAPGELKFMHPTDRPGEPVTSGLNVGPGAGPEALNAMPLGMVANNMAESDSTAALIANLAARPGAGSVLRSLAGQAASGPLR